jgi:alkaline phosphatase D
MRRLPLALMLSLAVVPIARPADATTPLTHFAFGSVLEPNLPMPAVEALIASKPELFVFLGDMVYNDTADMAVMKQKYEVARALPMYQKLRAAVPMIGMWDDRDFGQNDGGASYGPKAESQKQYLDFVGAAPDDPRRKQEGVYISHFYGPPGKRTQIILLDYRYHRGPLVRGGARGEAGEMSTQGYVPNRDPKVTVLGAAQWEWLEAQLRQPADLRIIGSGVEVVSNQTGFECWGNFPLERKKLLNLIRDTGAKGVLILSGDHRRAELSLLPASDPDGPGYPLYDLCGSSINSPYVRLKEATGVRFANELNPNRVGNTYFEENFGAVRIDWTQADPVIRLQIKDKVGDVVIQQRITLGELQRR